MFQKYLKLLALAGAEVLLLWILVGCESQPPGRPPGDVRQGVEQDADTGKSGTLRDAAEGEPQQDLSGQPVLAGRLRIAGSSSMEKLADVLSECFMEKYPRVTVAVQYIGSSAGVAAVLEGTADIGLCSRDLSGEERAAGAVDKTVAEDGVVVCVDPDNPVTGLTYSQLREIYTGRITNWSQVGGMDVPIMVVGREAGSGTRTAFEQLLEIRDQCTYANELDGVGAVMARVSSTPGAIGYVSFDVEKEGVAVLALEGTEPGAETILSGEYMLHRPLAMVVRGEEEGWGELIQAWFEFVYSEEGKDAAKKAGFIMVQSPET